MSEEMLRTRDLAKNFGGVAVARGIDLAVPRGEIRGLIGPNGAGKSTLCNLLSGIYPPSRGDVWLDGRKVTGLGSGRIAHLGLMRSFQVPRLFPTMTVLDNLMVPFLAQRVRRARHAGLRRADELLETTRLAALRDLPAGALSGGQQALLQIAVGFMVEGVKCYVLDEPFAGINPVIKETILDLIRRKNESDATTFVIVSHEMSVVRRLCHTVSVLVEGRVLAEGTVAEVAANEQVIDAYLGRTWS